MQLLRFFSMLCVLVSFLGCEKDPVVPTPQVQPFTVNVQNDYGEIQSRFALFLSDADGKLLTFRWLPGNDTARVQAPGTSVNDRLDCTVVKITTFDAPGTGIRDTTLELTTYTKILNGETIRLRDPEYRQIVDFWVNFTGMTTLDSIIVPDGLTFVRPQAANNFSGQYRVYHSGQIWVRVLADGNPLWRYTLLDKVSGPSLTTSINVGQMTPIFAKPPKVKFPFVAPWQYKVYGIVDSAAKQFIPIGDLLRAPGGAVPSFDQLSVIEPNPGDPQIPVALPYQLYRLSANGPSDGSSGYHYYLDKIYKTLPENAPVPNFDITPTSLADKRSVAVQCVGTFDVLSLNWTHAGTPNVHWEVLAAPTNDVVAYHLPQVPAELSARYPPLLGYQFSGGVRVRAESYEQFTLFEAILRQKLRNIDPLWQARAGYLAKEKVF